MPKQCKSPIMRTGESHIQNTSCFKPLEHVEERWLGAWDYVDQPHDFVRRSRLMWECQSCGFITFLHKDKKKPYLGKKKELELAQKRLKDVA